MAFQSAVHAVSAINGVKIKMNKNNKLALALAAIALPLILVSASYQTLATNEEPEGVTIDFAVYPESDTIVVERGKVATIPLKVEAANDEQMTLQLRLALERGNADPAKLQAALSKATLVLSELDVADGKVTDLGNGRGLRDAGVLTLTPAASMSPGTYTFGIEAEKQADGKLADALVSGTIVTIEVK